MQASTFFLGGVLKYNQQEKSIMNKNYYTLLVWQGVCVGSTFWIPEIGWIYFLIGVALCLLVETLVSKYAKDQGLQVFGTPFKGDKYLQDEALMIAQLCLSVLLWVVSLVLLGTYVLWGEFWIVMIVGILAFLLFCVFYKQKQVRRKR